MRTIMLGRFPSPRVFIPAFALCAAGAGFSPVWADEMPWLVHSEPMGAKASRWVERTLQANPSPEVAAQLAREAMQLPPGQAVSVLERALRDEKMPVAVKDAVLNLLAQDPACPLSRRMADAVLFQGLRTQSSGDLWRRSLRRLNTPEVVGVLGAWARDEALPLEQRTAALQALGGLPSLASLDVLLDMAANADANDWSLREMANKGLMEMFYLGAPPAAAQFAEWRTMLKTRDPMLFNLKLKDGLERALDASRTENGKLIEQIVRGEEALFDNESTAARQAHLAHMLGNKERVEMRLKGLELIDKQLQLSQPIEAGVRQAMRAGISDPVPQVRAKNVSLLDILRDEPSARAVAKRLSARLEDNTEVLAAMMLRMKRDPQPEALPAVIRLLGHSAPVVRTAAADALIEYGERKLLDDAARTGIAASLKARLAKETDPADSWVRLFGATLAQSDAAGWDMVRAWLANPRSNQALREAAALALARSSQPLGPLLACVDDADPRIAETAMRAVGERGLFRADAQPLLKKPPEAGAKRDAWGDALLGWSSRAAPADVDAITRELSGGGHAVNEEYRSKQAIRMLGRVLGQDPKNLSNENRALLLLRWAQIAELAGELTVAQEKNDDAYDWLPASERTATLSKRVQLRLAQGKDADAAQVWAKVATGNADAQVLKPALIQITAKMRELGEAGQTAKAVELLKVLDAAMKDKPAAALSGEVAPWLAKWAPPVPPPAAPAAAPSPAAPKPPGP